MWVTLVFDSGRLVQQLRGFRGINCRRRCNKQAYLRIDKPARHAPVFRSFFLHPVQQHVGELLPVELHSGYVNKAGQRSGHGDDCRQSQH